MTKTILVLWPSFWVAGIGEAIFFTLIDPKQLYLLGQPVDFSPIATYSIGFFALWALCATSSCAALFLLKTPSGRVDQ